MSDAEGSSKSLHRSARLIGGLTLVSRVLGLVREGVAAHFLGAQSIAANAFAIAFLVPNLFRKLLGEGALSQAFIPLYAQAVRRGETETGDTPLHFAAGSVKLLATLLLALTVLGELILAGLLWAYRGGERADVLLMLQFTAIMLPYVVLVCGGAFLSAILQVHKRFGAPAFAPVLLNVVHIVVVFGGAWWLGLRGHGDPNDPRINALQTRLAYWLSAAVLFAGVLQVMVLLPALRAAGFRFHLRLPAWTADTKKMLRLSLPVALGAAVLQISVALDKGISAALMQGKTTTDAVLTHFDLLGHSIRYPMEAGAVVHLNLAQLLYQFPLGIFAIAIATAIYPSLSTAAIAEDRSEFKKVVRQGVLATLWEGIPASVGLILVADPAVRLLFQHGYITAHDATLIARDTMVYAGGIWAYSMLQVINRAYYALHDAKTPLYASIINIVANVVVEVPLLWHFGEAAMAIGTLVSFSIQAIVMLWLLDRRLGGLGWGELLKPTAKILLATTIMTAVCLALINLGIHPMMRTHGWTSDGRPFWLFQLIVLSGVGAGVYLLSCRAMGVNTFGRSE